MITISENKVFLRNKCIGKLVKNKTTFLSHRNITKHLYRKLNSFGINEEIVLQVNIKQVVIKLGKHKFFRIKVDKIKEFMSKYRSIVNYNKYERQIMIPLAIMDVCNGNPDEISLGYTVEKFNNLLTDPRSLYQQWRERKKQYEIN